METEVYSFNALAGNAITLRAVPTTDALTVRMDLYDPDGLLVVSATSPLTRVLTKTGV